MSTPSPEEIENVAQAISALHAETVRDPDARRVGEAAANLCSGAGAELLYAPPEVQQLIANAIEIGYAAALQDLRDGALSEELQG